ncbi:hypothetical protein ACFVU3_28590 [Streptomyces sp. NPDC058052]|uniref:hypothetical protein n=1 Tax=Streptomyces sp. NPDC058052 TaxID=3346316 RepID=UPI0036E7D97F
MPELLNVFNYAPGEVVRVTPGSRIQPPMSMANSAFDTRAHAAPPWTRCPTRASEVFLELGNIPEPAQQRMILEPADIRSWFSPMQPLA